MRSLVILALALGVGAFTLPAEANREPIAVTPAAPAPKPEAVSYVEAQQAVEDGDYDRAIKLLKELVEVDADNADAWNLLGYSNRKIQNFDLAFTYYEKALAIDPNHKNAHEYIGEAYLELGELEKAEEHLGKLGGICFMGCDQFDQLEEQVKLFRANHTG